MAGQITAITVTSSQINSDADFRRVDGKTNGKVNGTFYLWYKKGEGEPILEIRITHEDKAPGENFEKVAQNLSKTEGKHAYLWYRTKGEGSPIIELKVIVADEVPGPGFSRASEELNPDAAGGKEYLTFKTRAAQQKLDARDFKTGDLVDCLDTANSWLVARIIGVDPKADTVQIHYEGWESRWDEWIARKSPRIAAHGLHTGGKFTGSSQSRAPFNLFTELATFVPVEKRLNEVVTAIETKSAELISKAQDEKGKAALPAALQLASLLPKEDVQFLQLHDNYKFLINIMNAVVDDPKLFPRCQAFLQRNIDYLLFALKNENEINLPIQNELMLVFGSDASFGRFYREYGTTPEDKLDEPTGTAFGRRQPLGEDPKVLPSIFLIQNINKFGNGGGFQAIANRLKNKSGKESFASMTNLIRLLAGLRPNLAPEFLQPFLTDLSLHTLVHQRLSQVTDEDLKTLDKAALNDLSINVQALIGTIMPAAALSEFSERTQLAICHRLLNSQVLAKRIEGCTHMDLFLQMVRRADPNQQQQQAAASSHGGTQIPGGLAMSYLVNAPPPAPVAQAQYITPPVMVQWITENKIVESLLARDSHEQVIKRSPPVLKFLASQGALTVNHIALLFNAARGKHEGLVRIVYDTLGDLSQELDETHLDGLFEDIKQKDLAAYKDYDLNFVKNFTINAVRTTQGKNKWYGLDIFWQMLQVGDAVPANIAQIATTILTDLLSKDLFAAQLPVYLDKCVTTLKRGPTSAVLQALKLSQVIIQGGPEQGTRERKSREEIIHRLDEEHKLVKLYMDDTARYIAEATKTLADVKDVKADPVVAGAPHSQQIAVRFAFLDFMLSNSDIQLSQAEVDQLWIVYVTNPVLPSDRDKFFTWLSKAADAKNHKKSALLNAQLTNYIFTSLLSNQAKLNFSTLSTPAYTCFESFFIHVNTVEDAIEHSQRGGTVVLNHTKLVGMAPLWAMVALAQDANVSNSAARLLCTLHIKLDWSAASKDKKAVLKAFVDKCMATLKDINAAVSGADNKDNKDAKAVDKKALSHRAAQVLNLVESFLFRLNNGELIAKPKFAEGQRIQATWMAQKTRYMAEVKKVNRDGTYVVLYSDGDTDHFCPERNMFSLEAAADNKGQEEEEELASYPRGVLSNQQEYFDLLFDLLGYGGEVAKSVIRLLTRLPQNQRLYNMIKNLGSQANVDWNQILPADSVLKLSYTLRIVRDNVITPPPPAPPVEGQQVDPADIARYEALKKSLAEWSDMFINKGGFVHLVNIIMNANIPEMLSSLLTQECLFHLLEILCAFLVGAKANGLVQHDKILPHCMNIAEKALAVPVPEGEKKKKLQEIDPVQAEIDKEKSQLAAIIAHAMHPIYLSSTHKPSLLTDIIFKQASWDKILIAGLLHKSPYARQNILHGLRNLSNFAPTTGFLLPRLLKALGDIDTTRHSALCSEYFVLLQELLIKNQAASQADAKEAKDAAPLFDAKELTSNLCQKIKNHPVLEASPQHVDYMLSGLLQLTRQLVQQQPAIKEPLGAGGLIEDLLHCLFDAPTGGRSAGPQPPKCKSAHSRQLAYALLAELAINCPTNARKVIDAVTPNHLLSHSGLARVDEWAFESRLEEKSNTGYMGINNLGCICYMIANLQQLFMLPRFRANVLAVDSYKEEDLGENVIYQLQHTFAQLQESEKQACDVRQFCHAFKDPDGKPTDVRVQDDSGQFLLRLLDRVAMGLKGTKYSSAVRDVLGGVLSHELIGKEPCIHYREREEEFYGISVEIKDKKTLDESLHAFIQGELLEGGNAFKCDACGKKVDTLKRQCMKKLPPTMVFILKRFELDYNTMETTKVNSRLEFPFKLNLKPYCKESLPVPKTHINVNAPKPAATDAKGASGAAPAPEKPVEAHPDEYYEYELRGIVVHMGSAHGGHYYSYIQERLEGDAEGKWYEFNDSRVTPIDPKIIPDECYGGAEERPAYRSVYAGYGSDSAGGAGTGATYEKSRNAYIIYYDRVKSKLTEEAAPPAAAASAAAQADDKKMSFSSAAQVLRVAAKQRKATRALRVRAEVPPKMFSAIWKQNLTYWRDKAVFDKNYFEFLWNIVEKVQVPAAPANAPNANALVIPGKDAPDHVAVAILATRFVLMTLSRAREKDSLNQWFGKLKRLYDSDHSLGVWLLKEMMNPEFMWALDFLMGCPENDVRNHVAEIICKILSYTSPLEQKALEPGAHIVQKVEVDGKDGKETKDIKVGAGHATRFINGLIALFNYAPAHSRSFDPYFRVLSHFASLGPAETIFLLREHNLLARVVDLFVGEKSNHPEVNQFVLDPKGRRIKMGDEYGYRPPEFTHLLILVNRLVTFSMPPPVSAISGDNKGAVELKVAPPTATAPLNQLVPLSKAACDLVVASDKGEFIAKLMASASSARKGKIASNIIAHLIWENEPFSQLIIAAIAHALEENDYDGARPYFRIMMRLVQMKDSVASRRTELLLQKLIQVVSAQLKYWKITDFCIDHLIRMAKKSPDVYKFLNSQPKLVDGICQWLTAHPEPPSYMRAGGDDTQLLKPERMDARSYGTSGYSYVGVGMGGRGNEGVATSYSSHTGIHPAKKIEALTLIKENKALDAENATDSDVDFSERVLKVGDWIDCLDQVSKWVVAQVVRVEGNRVEVHYDGWSDKWNEWIDASDPRIRALGTKAAKDLVDNRGKAPAPKPH